MLKAETFQQTEDNQTEWYSGKIADLSAGRHGGLEFNPRPGQVRGSIPI